MQLAKPDVCVVESGTSFADCVRHTIWMHHFSGKLGVNTQVAKSGGVVVGRDNSGTIVTGDRGPAAPQPSSGGWIGVAGIIVAILGAIIAALAWWFPRPPP